MELGTIRYWEEFLEEGIIFSSFKDHVGASWVEKAWNGVGFPDGKRACAKEW